jgi:hypothetical protein
MKCPRCNGCVEDRWIGYNFYYYCFLCVKYYQIDLKSRKLIEVNPEELK